MAAGGGVVAAADDVSWLGDGVFPADGLLEQPATANISAATTTKNNRLILVSRSAEKDLKNSTKLSRAIRARASICGTPSQSDQADQDQPNQINSVRIVRSSGPGAP